MADKKGNPDAVLSSAVLSDAYHKTKRNFLFFSVAIIIVWATRSSAIGLPGFGETAKLDKYVAIAFLWLACTYFGIEFFIEYRVAVRRNSVAVHGENADLTLEGLYLQQRNAAESLIDLLRSINNDLSSKFAVAFGDDFGSISKRKQEIVGRIANNILEQLAREIASLPRTPETSNFIDTAPIRMSMRANQDIEAVLTPLVQLSEGVGAPLIRPDLVERLEESIKQSELQERDFKLLSRSIYSEHRVSIEWKDKFVPFGMYILASCLFLREYVSHFLS